ncbi:MAG: hypothetical protein J6L85_08200 [Clostridia bacterium]|nr:hypothetical protein [Clostridia bacterium]
MKARLVDIKGHRQVEINGKVIPFTAYRSWRPNEDNLAAFNDRGFPIMTLLPSGIKNRFGIPYSAFGEYWIGEGKYDFDILKRQIDQFVNAAPDVYLAINLMLDTRDWFLRDHPECLNSFIYFSSVCFYEPWIKCAERMLSDTIDFLEREYPEKVFCIFLSAGGTCEWHNKALDLPTSALRDGAFRKYVGDPKAKIPTETDIEKTSFGNFREPSKLKTEIAFCHFTNEIMNNALAHFARFVKEYTDGRLLVGAPAGYALIGAHPLSGHSSVADIMKISDIDIIVCPASYFHRRLDNVSASQSAMDSVRANGKLFITSVDNTSYFANTDPLAQALQLDGSHVRHDSAEETIHYIRRETALSMSKGAGFWFFDMYGSWYPNANIRNELKRVREAYARLCECDTEYNSEIAFLADPRGTIYTNKGVLIREESIQAQITELGKVGAPVDYYTVDDILLDNFPREKYKLYIVPACYAPSVGIRAEIKRLRKNASFIFVGACGCITEDGFSFDAGADFTGIMTEPDPTPDGYSLISEEYNDTGAKKLYAGKKYGEIKPVMKAVSGKYETVATDLLSGSERMVISEREGGFDIWSFRGTLPVSFLRTIAKRAGVFLYQTDGLPTYANSSMLALFDHKGGEHKVILPKKCRLTEVYTGEVHEYDGEALSLKFAPNECKSFIIENNREK